MNRRNIALDLILTVLTCGLWNLVVQYDQIQSLNILMKEEKYNIWKISLYIILTCGIYFIYFEYLKSVDFARHRQPQPELHGADDSDAIIAVILTLFGLPWIYDAILQTKINEYIDQQDPVPHP